MARKPHRLRRRRSLDGDDAVDVYVFETAGELLTDVILDRVERKGRGLNLCIETLGGILCHDGPEFRGATQT